MTVILFDLHVKATRVVFFFTNPGDKTILDGKAPIYCLESYQKNEIVHTCRH